jgi:hypothetical protein
MEGIKLKHYTASIVANFGTAREATRDSTEITASDDSEAIQKADEWRGHSGKAEDGDYLVVVLDGRVVTDRQLRVVH